jgi:hypothetical protein
MAKKKLTAAERLVDEQMLVKRFNLIIFRLRHTPRREKWQCLHNRANKRKGVHK